MTVTTNIGLPLLNPSQSQPHVPINTSMMRLDALVPGVALAIANSPESGPDGSVWIVGVGEGEFSGQDDKIAIFYDGYHFIEPQDGWEFYVQSESVRYRFTTGGGWEEVEGGGGGGGGSGFLTVEDGRLKNPPSLDSESAPLQYLIPIDDPTGDWNTHAGERAVWHPETEEWEYINDDPANSVAVDTKGLVYRKVSSDWVEWQLPRNFLGKKLTAGFGTSIPSATDTAIDWTGVAGETDGLACSWTFSDKTKITAKVSGVFNMTAHVMFAAGDIGSGHDVLLKLVKNGSSTANPIAIASFRGPADAGIDFAASISAMVHLEVDDYVELYVYQNSGSSIYTTVLSTNSAQHFGVDYLGKVVTA